MFCSDAFRFTRFARRVLTLSGEVRSTSNGPLSDIAIEYFINGEFFATTTNGTGRYSIRVREGDHVRIMPLLGVGVMAQPRHYVICCARCDNFGLDFDISPLTAQVQISGVLIGTTPLVANATINYTVDGTAKTVMSDEVGMYEFSVPVGSDVIITAPAIPNFTAIPPSIALMNLQADMNDQDFTYMPLV